MQETLFSAVFRQNNFFVRGRMVAREHTKKGVLLMLLTLGSYVRGCRRLLRRLLMEPKLKLPARLLGSFLLGLVLSAASLGNCPQPFALSLLCAGISGPLAVPLALGAAAGYALFWNAAGSQAIIWTAAGLPVCLLLGQKRISRQMPFLLPSLAALIVSFSGVAFQVWYGDDTVVFMYLMRVAVAFGSAWLFSVVLQRRDSVADWELKSYCQENADWLC